MSNFIDTAKAVFAREAVIEEFKGNVAENREAANAQKISAYSEIIASLASVDLTAKGKLPRSVSTDLRDSLINAGVSKSCTKRYVENSTAALRVFDVPSQATPELVEEILECENISSENALKKACFASRDVSEARAFAEKIVGKFKTRYTDSGKEVETDEFVPSKLSDDEIDDMIAEFNEAVSGLRAVREEAIEGARIGKEKLSDKVIIDAGKHTHSIENYIAEGLGEMA